MAINIPLMLLMQHCLWFGLRLASLCIWNRSPGRGQSEEIRCLTQKTALGRQKPGRDCEGALVVQEELNRVQTEAVVDTVPDEVSVVNGDLIFGHKPKLKSTDKVKLVNAEEGPL